MRKILKISLLAMALMLGHHAMAQGRPRNLKFWTVYTTNDNPVYTDCSATIGVLSSLDNPFCITYSPAFSKTFNTPITIHKIEYVTSAPIDFYLRIPTDIIPPADELAGPPWGVTSPNCLIHPVVVLAGSQGWLAGLGIDYQSSVSTLPIEIPLPRGTRLDTQTVFFHDGRWGLGNSTISCTTPPGLIVVTYTVGK